MIRTPRKSGRFKRPVDGPKPTGGQLVYEALRQDIIGLRLAPGEPLEELQLCRTYRVSRTPVREALIRLAADDLVALEPNRGAKVESMQFIDVVDHYEAMDIFLPLISYFAAVRRTANDLAVIETRLADFRNAVARKNADAIILANFNLHGAIAAACHNGSLEKAHRRMLVDKLRIAQYDIRASSGAASSLAHRFNRTFQLTGIGLGHRRRQARCRRQGGCRAKRLCPDPGCREPLRQSRAGDKGAAWPVEENCRKPSQVQFSAIGTAGQAYSICNGD